MGWRHCGKCRSFNKIKFVKDVIYHEDEPPIFHHWECSKCGRASPIQPSRLMDDSAKSFGYNDFMDFAKQNELLKKT